MLLTVRLIGSLTGRKAVNGYIFWIISSDTAAWAHVANAIAAATVTDIAHHFLFIALSFTRPRRAIEFHILSGRQE